MDFHALGYRNQIRADFSQFLINAMMTKYIKLHTKRSVMDLRQLKLPTVSADIAVDKGTLEAFTHG